MASPSSAKLTLSNINIVSNTEIDATVMPEANDIISSTEITVDNSPTGGMSTNETGTVLCNCISWTQHGFISTNDGTTPPTQNAVVGQQIALTTAKLPSGITAESTTWTVENGTNIGGYTASTKGASVTPMPPLNTPNLTFYSVYPQGNISITYQYCVNITGANPVLQCSLVANANFNVTGPTGGTMSVLPYSPGVSLANLTACTLNGKSYPGGPWMIYAQGVNGIVTGTACPGGKIITAAGITFNTPTGYANSSGGSFSLVQLIGNDVSTVVTMSPGLDSSYPYPGPPSNDSPAIYLPSNLTDVNRSFTADMFLMWKSVTPNSIPIPIGYQQWGFSGTATCSSDCGTASNWMVANTPETTPGQVGSFVTSSQLQTQTNDGYNMLVDGYPTWIGPSQ